MDWMDLATMWLGNWAFFVLRYVLIAGGAFGIVWVLGRRYFATRRIRRCEIERGQVGRELLWSVVSAGIFVAVSSLSIVAGAHGYTLMYWEVADYGWPWFFASVPVMVLVHDAYFYWIHRLMHEVGALQGIHRLHHTSRSPTPWSAFAFHPGEALLEAGVLPLLVLTIPLHTTAIVAFTTIMTATSVMIHLGYELYPTWLRASRLGGWLMTATLHSAHHAGLRGSYGLYLLAWDRWMRSVTTGRPHAGRT